MTAIARARRGTVLLLLAVAACQQPKPAPITTTLGTSWDPDPYFLALVGSSLGAMHASYSTTDQILRAVAFGRLEVARAAAGRVARPDDMDAAPRWQPFYQAVRSAAAAVEAASTVPDAARATALLARACATCHEEVGAMLRFDPNPAPAGGHQVIQQMQTHRWASERLWQGLIASSNPRWLDGAEQLVAAPLAIPDANPGVAADVTALRRHAARAMDAGPQAERATIFGELLATCAGCHTRGAGGAR